MLSAKQNGKFCEFLLTNLPLSDISSAHGGLIIGDVNYLQVVYIIREVPVKRVTGYLEVRGRYTGYSQ